MKKFYILFPYDAYAIEWFAKSKKEFISEVKKYFGYKRLPNGTEYWEIKQLMEKFHDNSEFTIYTDKRNEIVDLFDKQRDQKIKYMINKIDEAIIYTVSCETLLKAKQEIDVELNRRIDKGDFKCLKN